MANTFNFTAEVTDANATTATQNLTVTINAAVSITTSSLPDVVEATNYSATVTVAGGTAPLTWSIAQGTLPEGMSLNSNSGVISGMSLTLGTSNFTVAVTDSNGSIANQALSITVLPMVAQLTDSLGNQSSYTSAVSGGMWYVTDSSGSGCSSCTLRGETHNSE